MTNPDKLQQRLEKFLAENLPPEDDVAGYVFCIAHRDKTITVAQGYTSGEVRDKVAKALNQHLDTWEAPARS